MSFYKEPPFDELAADRRIKQVVSGMFNGTATPEDFHEAQRLISARAESLTRNSSLRYGPEFQGLRERMEARRAVRRADIEEHMQARRAARAERYLARFEQAAEPQASEGVIAKIAGVFKRGLGFGS